MKHLGKRWKDCEVCKVHRFLFDIHFKVALLEVADLVEGWREGIDINGVKTRVAPNDSHLERLIELLKETVK